MEYQLYSKNVDITDSLKEYLGMRLAHHDRLQIEAISVRVDISRDTHHRKGEIFRVEINFNVTGKLLRVVEYNQDVRAAIDRATETLDRQLTKYKSKKIDSRKRRGRLLDKFFRK